MAPRGERQPDPRAVTRARHSYEAKSEEQRYGG